MRDRQIFRKSHIKFIRGDPATASSSTVPPISGIVLVWLNILAFPVFLAMCGVGHGEKALLAPEKLMIPILV